MLRELGSGPGAPRRWIAVFSLGAALMALPLVGQTLDLKQVFDQRNLPPVRELLEQGEYLQTARLCELYIQNGAPSPEWWQMRLQALVSLGQVDETLKVAREAARLHEEDLALLMTCHDAALRFGRKEPAADWLKQINTVARKRSAVTRTAADTVALGRAALAAGADPAKVIEQFFTPAKKKQPELLDSYLAAGNLALAKSDYARAANEFREGLKHQSTNNALRFGLARAFQASDRKRSLELCNQILKTNPWHAGALLLIAEHDIGSEEFTAADEALDRLIDYYDRHPEAWALKGVLAILVANDESKAEAARSKGLEEWAENPSVDFIMGRCLSRAYRFREAAGHFREALKIAPTHLDAKLQLCHALFRLGNEDEAWGLAAEIRKADAYNVQAYNIGLLEAEMKGFHVREEPDFVLKMPARDAAIYGDRALVLLREAKESLCAKYGLVLDHPVLVEFFPSQQDFAIRTFGNLGGQGILGACFGTVVTMNSPGSIAANRSNWESTLWHEFCHVVTLTVTRNRMPRWLSEGISVYEEERRDPSWGMRMSASYRAMILDEETFTPLSKLSRAFLSPASSDHLMFAYYESAQAVAWLVETYGEQKFQRVLKDLAEGRRINEALSRHTAPAEEVDTAFSAHLQAKARALASEADWEKPEAETVDPRDPKAVLAYLKENPKNLWALRTACSRLLAAEQWSEALAMAQRLSALFPDDPDASNGYFLAAQAYRGLKQPNEESASLRQWLRRSADAAPASLRLMELDAQSKNWAGLREAAQRMLAIDPFLKRPHEALAEASEAQGDKESATTALKHLLTLGPDNPVQVNYSLARLLQEKDVKAARRHVLDALAEAPRFRAGHELLLQLQSPPP